MTDEGFLLGCSEPVVLDALKDIGFNALALSNNHAFDLGPPGVLSTLEEAAERGFHHAGIDVDAEDARRPGMKTFGARKVALASRERDDRGLGGPFMLARPADRVKTGAKMLCGRLLAEPTA